MKQDDDVVSSKVVRSSLVDRRAWLKGTAALASAAAGWRWVGANLLAGSRASAGETLPSSPSGGGGPTAERRGWGPTVDGTVLPRHPFDPDAPALLADVPMLIGTVLHESSPSMDNAEAERLREREMSSELSKRYGARNSEVLAVARHIYPTRNLWNCSRSSRDPAPTRSCRRRGKPRKVQRLHSSISSPGRRQFSTAGRGRSTARRSHSSSTTPFCICDGRHSRGACTRCTRQRRLDQLCTARRSRPRGLAEVAGVLAGARPSDDVRHHLRHQERSRSRTS